MGEHEPRVYIANHDLRSQWGCVDFVPVLKLDVDPLFLRFVQ